MSIRLGQAAKLAAMALGAVAFAAAAGADEWSPDEITIVVPHSLGGGHERLTQTFANVWSKHLGIPLKLEPRRGAGGRVGFDYFVRQPTDGTYIVSTNVETTALMWVQQNPDWDWNENVGMLGIFGLDPAVYAVHKDSDITSFEDLLARAKEHDLTGSISQWNTTENFNAHQVAEMTGAQFQMIPSDGGGHTVTAVLGQHVDFGITKVTNLLRAGDDLRFLAIVQPSNDLSSKIGNIPTVGEVVGAQTLDSASYRIIAVPASLKDEYPERYELLRSTFEAAKDDPEYVEAALKAGLTEELIPDMTPEQLQTAVEGLWTAYRHNKDIFDAGN